MNAFESIALGLLLLLVGFLMRRSAKRHRRRPETDPSEEVRTQFLQAEKTSRSNLEQLELRLHDFAREVDALTQTRIGTLAELVTAADEAVCELDERLAGQSRAGGTAAGLTAQQQRMVALLSGAGYQAGSIAALIGRPVEEVRALLSDDAEQADAA
ncbi:MAG: hypothetical protein ACE5KM_14775 [Planctomycetaceae bacterium]